MKKYVVTKEMKVMSCGTWVYRIQAFRDIPEHNVRAGQFGGFIEKEENLPHDEDDASWVAGEAVVMNDSTLSGEVLLLNYAIVEGDCALSGDIMVSGRSRLTDCRLEGENIQIAKYAKLEEVQLKGTNIHITGHANCYGIETEESVRDLAITDDVLITGATYTTIGGKNIRLSGSVSIEEGAVIVGENIELLDHVFLLGQPTLKGNNIRLEDSVSLAGDVRLGDDCSLKDCVELVENEVSFDPVLTGLQLSGDVSLHVGEVYEIMQKSK